MDLEFHSRSKSADGIKGIRVKNYFHELQSNKKWKSVNRGKGWLHYTFLLDKDINLKN